MLKYGRNVILFCMKHIVILTDSYYPIMAPVASCVSKIVDVLKEDNKISIIYPIIRTKYKLVQNERIHYYEISCWHNDLRAWSHGRLDRNSRDLLGKIVLLFVRTYGFILSTFAFPTRSSWLRKRYFKALKQIRVKENIDIILSASDPFCSHLAVLDYKKKYSLNKWITYTLDPFYYNTYNYTNIFFKSSRRKKNLRIETQVFQNADYNIFTEELYDVIIELCKLNKDSCFCFPYVLQDFSSLKYSKKTSIDEVPILVYAGTLKSKIRNPQVMLSVCSRVKGIILKLYASGDCEYVYDQYRTPNIEYNRLLLKEQYLDMIVNKADVLVNIGNTVMLQSPSKFLEFMSTGKPIINFYYKKDTIYRMIEKYPLGINIGDDSDDSVKKVKIFVEKNYGKICKYKELINLYPNNNPEYQRQILLNLVNE